jgi:hypothetical protein
MDLLPSLTIIKEWYMIIISEPMFCPIFYGTSYKAKDHPKWEQTIVGLAHKSQPDDTTSTRVNLMGI